MQLKSKLHNDLYGCWQYELDLYFCYQHVQETFTMVSQRCMQMRNRARQVLQKAKEKTGASEEGLVPQGLLEVSLKHLENLF